MPDEQRMPGFDPAILSDAETEVVARTARGEIAVFAEAEPPVVRASFLRHLLLGLPTREPWPIRLPGVRICGARIDEGLDVEGCAGPAGAGLPAIALEGCEIGAPMNLAHARLARLSLRDSRIAEVCARGLRVDGTCDFSGISPLHKTAWIDAHAVVIDGDLLARGARLQIPPPRPGIAHRDARYALRLSGADIRGSLDLAGGFTAIGGIALDTAHVGGDVVARGARVSAGEGDAIGAQAAQFDGVVILGDGFVAAGVIWLMGAHIGATLDMSNARLMNRTEDGTGVALAADTAEIGGSVLLRNGLVAEGTISLRGARIGRSLECDGSTLSNATADGSGIALAVDHSEIGGAVLLRNGLATHGAISLIGAHIGGNLECDGATLRNRTSDGTGLALAAENAVIGGAVLLRHGFTAGGGVSLLGARIGSNVECCGASLENWPDTGSRETLRLTNAQVTGDVLLSQGFRNLGHVSLWGTKIGRDLDCSSATFVGPSTLSSGWSMAGALVATNLAVAGDVRLVDITIVGRLDCEHLETGGNLIWDGVRFPREANDGERRIGYRPGADALPRVLLSHARIGAALMARDLTAEMEMTIDLGGAKAETLDDDGFPAGWGVGRAREGVFCALNLDGFVYDRFGHLPSDEASGVGIALSAFGRWTSLLGAGRSAGWAVRLARRLVHAQRSHVQQRLAWVQQQQQRKGGEFHPQPYRHLAKVLRAQGHYQAGREVAIAEQWAMPPSSWASHLVRGIWGTCFGFGLSPVRATATLMLALAVGTLGVWWAWKQAGVLVINYSYAMTEVTDAPVFLHSEKGQTTAGAPACGQSDIEPLFYAMDMMVPVMTLHQIDKCWVDTGPGTEFWRLFWAVFSFVGKLATSLALLTYSGVLKPKEEV